MLTPMDRLVFTAAKFRSDHPIWPHMLELIKTHRLTVCRWSDWALTETTPILPERPVHMWNLGYNFCLFSEKGIIPQTYRAMLADGLEGLPPAPVPDKLEWQLEAVMVFKRDAAPGFDVIPLLRLLKYDQDLIWPDAQLRFTPVGTGGADWTWGLSPQGFVNHYVYDPIVRRMPPAAQERVRQSVEYTGNVLLRYLGGYDQLLQQGGIWHVQPAKPLRGKFDAKGKLKKIYEIAHLGYQQFVPDLKKA